MSGIIETLELALNYIKQLEPTNDTKKDTERISVIKEIKDKIIEEIEEDLGVEEAEVVVAYLHFTEQPYSNYRDIELKDAKNGYYLTDGDYEYLCGTDSQMDEAWDENLENYINECLEIPKNVIYYFDREKWKNDAKTDGRAHSLASYDGDENEQDGIYFYRTN